MNEPNPLKQQPKLDTPLKMKDIEMIANSFKKAKDAQPADKPLIPAGDHWQNNLSVDYYLGLLSGVQLAMRGLMNMRENIEANPDTLLSELNLVSGQLCEKIVEKTPKIITLNK